jgi:hypothetical protein
VHQANSSRKWRLMLKNAKMVKDDLSLSTYSQYVDDFKFWMKAARDTHKPPEKGREDFCIEMGSSQKFIEMKFIHVLVKIYEELLMRLGMN